MLECGLHRNAHFAVLPVFILGSHYNPRWHAYPTPPHPTPPHLPYPTSQANFQLSGRLNWSTILVSTLFGPQSRFGRKSLGIRLVCPQIGTAVLKGLMIASCVIKCHIQRRVYHHECVVRGLISTDSVGSYTAVTGAPSSRGLHPASRVLYQVYRNLHQHMSLCVFCTTTSINIFRFCLRNVRASNPFRTAVPFWGQTSQLPSTLSPKGNKVPRMLLACLTCHAQARP